MPQRLLHDEGKGICRKSTVVVALDRYERKKELYIRGTVLDRGWGS